MHKVMSVSLLIDIWLLYIAGWKCCEKKDKSLITLDSLSQISKFWQLYLFSNCIHRPPNPIVIILVSNLYHSQSHRNISLKLWIPNPDGHSLSSQSADAGSLHSLDINCFTSRLGDEICRSSSNVWSLGLDSRHPLLDSLQHYKHHAW